MEIAMPDSVKRFTVVVQRPVYFKFINKARFYEISSQDIFTVLLTKFNNGDFDDIFGISEEHMPDY